jgi:hypothetical protein
MTYSELITLPTFEERIKILMLNWRVGEQLSDRDRYYAQEFYHSYEWRNIVRPAVITRDNGYDLACPTHPIRGPIQVHHIFPITINDIKDGSKYLLDPEYLISMSDATHKAIHYGDQNKVMQRTSFIERTKNDTIPWR